MSQYLPLPTPCLSQSLTASHCLSQYVDESSQYLCHHGTYACVYVRVSLPAGILLRRLTSDPELATITHVIVDEVRERNVYSVTCDGWEYTAGYSFGRKGTVKCLTRKYQTGELCP